MRIEVVQEIGLARGQQRGRLLAFDRLGQQLGGAVVFHHHRHHRFAIIGDPFFDPFYYSYIPPRVAYPSKTVSFVNGHVVSIQFLSPPR